MQNNLSKIILSSFNHTKYVVVAFFLPFLLKKTKHRNNLVPALVLKPCLTFRAGNAKQGIKYSSTNNTLFTVSWLSDFLSP